MPRKITISKPIEHRALAKRSRLSATGKPKDSVLDISLNGVKGSRIIQEHGRLRVLPEVSGDGLRRQQQYDQIPVIRLSPKKIDRRLATRPILGYRPAGVPTTFVPKFAKPTHQLRPQRKKEVQHGGSIFERRMPRVPGETGRGIHDGPLQ